MPIRLALKIMFKQLFNSYVAPLEFSRQNMAIKFEIYEFEYSLR